MCYCKEIIVETTICLNNMLDFCPYYQQQKKISKILHNEDVIGKLENQELSTMPNNVKLGIDFGSTT
jgi:hypothetical protein